MNCFSHGHRSQESNDLRKVSKDFKLLVSFKDAVASAAWEHEALSPLTFPASVYVSLLGINRRYYYDYTVQRHNRCSLFNDGECQRRLYTLRVGSSLRKLAKGHYGDTIQQHRVIRIDRNTHGCRNILFHGIRYRLWRARVREDLLGGNTSCVHRYDL
jgi:hypothetical protein